MYQPIEPAEDEEARVSYMHDPDVYDDVKAFGFSAVYAIATSTEPENEQPWITPQDFVHKRTKDVYCQQASSTTCFSGFAYNCERDGSLARFEPINGEV